MGTLKGLARNGGTLTTESLVARTTSEGASDEVVVGRGSPTGSPDAVSVPGASETGVGPAFRALTAALDRERE
jgi:hypothetical protein